MRRLPLLATVALPTACFAIIPNYGPDTFFTGVGQLGGASCVAVSSHWVITARHVGGTSVNFGGNVFNAAQRFDHDEADIALLRFDVDLGVPTYGIDFSSPLGRTATLVGFGGTGDAGATGVILTGGGGVRRSAENVIDRANNVTFDNIDFFDSWEYDLDGPTGNGTLGQGALAREGGLWFGDSGGAWLVDNGGSWNLVGVNSYIDDGNNNGEFNNWGDLGGGVALKSYQGWINSHMAVPEPASLAALSLGMLAIVRRRRKR
jgi:hypothetical protein